MKLSEIYFNLVRKMPDQYHVIINGDLEKDLTDLGLDSNDWDLSKANIALGKLNDHLREKYNLGKLFNAKCDDDLMDFLLLDVFDLIKLQVADIPQDAGLELLMGNLLYVSSAFMAYYTNKDELVLTHQIKDGLEEIQHIQSSADWEANYQKQIDQQRQNILAFLSGKHIN